MIFKKWPEKKQWALFFKSLNKKEKIIFSIFFLSFFIFLFSIISNFYSDNTKSVPKKGGIHIEGVVGQPRFINPIYLESDTDKDIVEIIFSGLLKYDKNLEIVLDLAESYQIEEDGRVYRFFLRENIFWQDGAPITTEDILFTIKTIQNPDYKSHFRPNWLGVEVEKISDREIKFKLRRPYSSFLENLTLKILPKHIWQDVPAQKFFSDTHQLNPVGSGPYKIGTKKINQEKIESISLVKNPYYHGKEPYIEEIKFLFFDNEESLISSIKRKEVNAFYLSSPLKTDLNVNRLYFPRYFAIFFNSKESSLLEDINIRKALNYSIDKKSLLKNILKEEDEDKIERQVINSPILPNLYGIEEPSFIYEFNKEKAEELLDSAGFKMNEEGFREKTVIRENSFHFREDTKLDSKGKEVEELQRCLARFEDIYPEKEITAFFGEKTKDAVNRFQEKYREEILDPSGFSSGTGMVGESTRKKLNEICFKDVKEVTPLSFTLKTIEHPTLIEIANNIKDQWNNIGIRLNIERIPREEREQELIRPRNYEILLLGKVLGALPDFFPFWHSSQKEDLGYNLSLYENKEADKLLEEIRETTDENIKKEKMSLLQNIIIKDAPAVFLYSPDYIYTTKAKGIDTVKIADPSKRFTNIENWFLKSKRIWN